MNRKNNTKWNKRQFSFLSSLEFQMSMFLDLTFLYLHVYMKSWLDMFTIISLSPTQLQYNIDNVCNIV